jgi:hypothetical protein
MALANSSTSDGIIIDNMLSESDTSTRAAGARDRSHGIGVVRCSGSGRRHGDCRRRGRG